MHKYSGRTSGEVHPFQYRQPALNRFVHRPDCVGRMADSTNSSQLTPKDLVEEALGIIMNRFDLDAAQALKVLHRMSREARTKMCVVADQIIDYDDPVQA